MKKYHDLYASIAAFDKLYYAYRKARRNKRYTPAAATFAGNLDRELLALYRALGDRTWYPGGYVHFTVHEPKRRVISAAPFRDRVVHHALISVLEPIYERKFIYDSYANRVGKGTHKALDRCTQYMRRFKYVLQCDIKQFFPSIDHKILKDILAKTIACQPTLDLCAKIIDSGVGVLAGEYTLRYFPGDDLFAANRPRGLPIGNQTSQFWANVYMNELDQFVKHGLRCVGYVRYVDDFLLFADDKVTLHRWREEINTFLQRLRLAIHQQRAQPSPVEQGIPFLGFTVYPTHRRLKRSKGITYRRHLKTLWRRYQDGEITRETGRASVMAWIGHVRHGDTVGLRRKLFSELKT
ncbi:MAG: reverse transcriptase/maturase family protein [Chloroflexota bacterium]|nr:reverse transcriptase/maturase family protein [Chloroflexota bacterium]